jgi:hypothetical protein
MARASTQPLIQPGCDSDPFVSLGKRLGAVPTILSVFLLGGYVWALLHFFGAPGGRAGVVGTLLLVLLPVLSLATCVLVAAYWSAKEASGMECRRDSQ